MGWPMAVITFLGEYWNSRGNADETRSKRHYKKITKEKKNGFNLLNIQIIHGPTSPKKITMKIIK